MNNVKKREEAGRVAEREEKRKSRRRETNSCGF
jgi:hypothetical protein